MGAAQTTCCKQDVDASTEAIEPSIAQTSSDTALVSSPDAAGPTDMADDKEVPKAEVTDSQTEKVDDALKEEAASPKSSEILAAEPAVESDVSKKSEEPVAASQTDMLQPNDDLEVSSSAPASTPDKKPATKAKAKGKSKTKAKAKPVKKDETKATEAAPSPDEQGQPKQPTPEAEGPPATGGLSTQEEELLAAATSGDAKKIKALAKAGVKLDVKDGDGMTALHLATLANQEDAVGRILLDGKKILKKLLKAGNKNKDTALHLACAHDFKSIATMMVFEGADWKAKNAEGKTPLKLAKEELAKWLSTGDPISTRPPWLK